MAVVLGTNAGFVTTAPTADPAALTKIVDNKSTAVKDTSPANAGKIIEIGWWCNEPTQESNFEVGLYSDAGNDEPEVRLMVDDVNAKGTGTGWKRVMVDWAIDAETTYWLAIQLDNTISTTNIDSEPIAGAFAQKNSQTTLLSNWGSSDTIGTSLQAVYAVWEEIAGFTRKIKISGTFQDKPIKTKVAGTFEDKPIKIKVGGTFQDA